jgi:hypothetical protein
MPDGSPRSLPLQVKASLFMRSIPGLFGVVFFLFGLVFVFVFGSSVDFTSPFYFSSGDPVVMGTLLAKEGTNTSVNKQRIYAYRYRYTVDAKLHEGRSFAVNGEAAEGDAVQVQYAPGNPARSRLRGQRAAPFGWWVFAFVLVFPSVGLTLLHYAFKQFRQHLHLIENGVITTGKVIRQAPTSTRINGKTVMEVYFQFKTADGASHEASVTCVNTAVLLDEAREPLVYDAADPAKAVLLDALPPRIRTLLLGR